VWDTVSKDRQISTETKLNREEKTIILFSSTAHFFTHFFMLTFPAMVMPMSRDLGLTLAEVLNFSFWMYLLYGIVGLGWGWISDRFGHKWAMASGLLLAGLGFACVGFAASPFLISLFLATVGIGCSAYHPSGTALVSQGVRLRGRALGTVGVWGNAGIAAAPFAVGLLNLLMGWRAGVIVLGAMGFVLGVVTLLTPSMVERGEDRKVVNTTFERTDVWKLLAVFSLGLIFGGASFRAFTLLLPAFLEAKLGGLISSIQSVVLHWGSSLEDTADFRTFTATFVATVVYLMGMLGQKLGGKAADRFSLKWSYLMCFVLSLPFIVGMALLPDLLIVFAAGIFVLFSQGMQPIENSLVAALTPPRWRSVSYGAKFTLSFGAGSFAVKMVGAAEASYGIASAIWIVALFVLLVVINTAVFLFLSRGREIRH
jgi:MFS family permease